MRIKIISRKILFFILLLVSANQVIAQELKLVKYRPGEGLKFTEKHGNYNLRLQGYIQTSLETRKYENEEDFYNRFRMRRLRLRMIGEAPRLKLSYRLQTDFAQPASGDDEELNGMLLDASVTYHPNKRWKITFGQRVTPTDNRELMMGSQTLQLVERSRVTSAFASIREFGLFIDGRQKLWNSFYIKPMLAITDGDGINNIGQNYGGLKYGGRVNFLPFGLMNAFGEFRQGDMIREFTPKLSVGIFYSFNDGMSSRRGRESGSILYLNDKNEISLPDYTKYGVDFLFKYKGFSALGEFIRTRANVPTDITQRIRNDGSISTTFAGGVDAYVRGRMMLGSGINFQMGYLFKNNFSIDARYTFLAPDENSFLNNTLFYNRNNHYDIGISKYLDKHYGMKFQTSLTYVDAEAASRNIKGEVFEGREWIARFMVQVAF